MRLRLLELKKLDKKVWSIRVAGKLQDGYAKIDGVLHYQELPFMSKIIWTEIICRHYDNPLAGHLGVYKTRELIRRKYYWPSLRKDVESYIKGCNVCLGSKVMRHKSYRDLQSLLVPTHWWKDLSIDFVTGLPVSTNWKDETYDSILVIVNWLTKIVY